MDFRGYTDVIVDYLIYMANGQIQYKYEKGEYGIETKYGSLYATSTEWGWYPYRGEKIEYTRFNLAGVDKLIEWLGRIEQWL